jgi:hypothetical protein
VNRSRILLAIAPTLILWALWGATATASPPPTTGFLSEPTDQIAVPGMLAGAEITPEGDLYTGWAEYELRFGRGLARWNQPTRVLPDPGLPLLSSSLWDGAVRYTVSVFAVALAGEPVAYETVNATNDSARSREAQVAMALAYTRGPQVLGAHRLKTGAYRYERPVTGQASGFYDQPGQAFSAAFRYTTDGRDLDRSGLLLAAGRSRRRRRAPWRRVVRCGARRRWAPRRRMSRRRARRRRAR